jgi:Ser/Thr protein kinase RdoA (MazF antagonist)
MTEPTGHRDVSMSGFPTAPTDAATVRSHLRAHYRARVKKLTELDVGVYRVDRGDGPSWVARYFPPTRSLQAVEGDAEILNFLADYDMPAERCATPEPVSMVEGRALLVTEYVNSVPRQQRREAIVARGGLQYLADVMGRLHNLPAGAGAVTRDGGAWHHLADGPPSLEIEAAKAKLAETAPRVPGGEGVLFDGLRDALEKVDDGDGLPQALIHPDFALPNLVASPDRGLVMVDWAGTGRGAMAWSLAWFLYTEGAKDLARVDRILDEYRRHVELGPEELSRLEAIMRARPLTLQVWLWCVGWRSLAEVTAAVEESARLAAAVSARARAVHRSP